MCFVVSDKYPNELIAKKDIRCYKYMGKKGKYFCSPIYHTNWLLGVLIKARGRNGRKVLAVGKSVGKFETIEAGIHSCIKKTTADFYRGYDEILVQCTIPKGSRYYKNATEYVSDRIVIVKEVK